MERLTGKLFIRGKILVKTGIHIGGQGSSLEIGGIDNPVIRDVNGVPFIPGSSLKGKMRALLEWEAGRFKITLKTENDEKERTFPNLNDFWKEYLQANKENVKIEKIEGKPCDCGECNVCKLFGTPAQASSVTPSRLIVRDAFLDEEKFKETFKDAELDTDYTEVKDENTIDRLTSAANPRQMERVPAGAEFWFEFIVSLFGEEDREMLETLLKGMRLLEDDYLGGSGTRGYGRIEFKDIEIILRDRAFYEGREKEKVFPKAEKLSKIDLKEIDILGS